MQFLQETHNQAFPMKITSRLWGEKKGGKGFGEKKEALQTSKALIWGGGGGGVIVLSWRALSGQ